jgi:hypothetical protein
MKVARTNWVAAMSTIRIQRAAWLISDVSPF